MDYQLPPLQFFQTKALQRSVLYGSVRKTGFYLRRGCNPNVACGPHKMTPLMYVCYVQDPKKRDRIADMLLDGGGRPGIPDAFGRTAMHYAVWLDLDCLLARYLEGDDSNPIERDCNGNTTLHLAALKDRPHMLQLVVDKIRLQRMDLNALNEQGLTALDVALQLGHEDCTALLEREGCRSKLVNFVEENRKPCEDLKAREGCGDAIRMLLARKALSTLSSNEYTSLLQEPVTREWVRDIDEYKPRQEVPKSLGTGASHAARRVPSPLLRQVTVRNIVTTQ